MKISPTVQLVIVAAVVMLSVTLALATRYQNLGQDRRIDRWTGQQQEFYRGRWMSQEENEALRDKESVEANRQGSW